MHETCSAMYSVCYLEVHRQQDWTSICDPNCLVVLDELRVGRQAMHTSSQRWSSDVAPEMQKKM